METLDSAAVCRVVLTGSESTGKSTLARELAAHYRTVCCAESVRDYLDQKASRAGANSEPDTSVPTAFLTSEDVEPIARAQIEAEDAACHHANRILILDTDLLSTMVYARHYYGECPEWIVAEARRRCAHLYLLMDIDIPWVADPQRDRGDRREGMQDLFRAALQEIGARSFTIRGSWEERRMEAVRAIDARLKATKDG